MNAEDARSFEELRMRLDEIVSLVSDDSLPLDEALDLYEEAVGIGLSASRIMEEGIASADSSNQNVVSEGVLSSAAETESATDTDALHEGNK